MRRYRACPGPPRACAQNGAQSARVIGRRDEDAGALDAHFEAFRARRGERKGPTMDRGGKDARVHVVHF
eukprot:835562-Pyramimonas_sp.AAC.1